MKRKIKNNGMQCNVYKVGNSLALIIPKDIAKYLRITEASAFWLTFENNELKYKIMKERC